MKYKITRLEGAFTRSSEYRKTLDAAQRLFDSALDPILGDPAYGRAILMSNDGSGWLMMEEKFQKDGIIEWVEYDFNFELFFDDGQFLEVSQASSSAYSALDEVQMQYQDEELSSIEYVGWTS